MENEIGKLNLLLLNLCLMLFIVDHGHACDKNHEHKKGLSSVDNVNVNNQIVSESIRPSPDNSVSSSVEIIEFSKPSGDYSIGYKTIELSDESPETLTIKG